MKIRNKKKRKQEETKNGLPSPINSSFLLHIESVSCGSILVSIFAHIKNKAEKKNQNYEITIYMNERITTQKANDNHLAYTNASKQK